MSFTANAVADLPVAAKASGSSVLGSAASGAASGAAIGSIVPGVGTVIGGAVGGAIGAVTSLFSGIGDKSPFQDAMVAEIAKLAATGDRSARQFLAGTSGRYGAVAVDDKAAVKQALRAAWQRERGGDGLDAYNWAGGDADPHPNLAGPTERVGSQDLAWQAFQLVEQHLGCQVPPPNEYATNSPGHIANLGAPTELPFAAATTLGAAGMIPGAAVARLEAGLGSLGGSVFGIPIWLLVLGVLASIYIGTRRS